MFAFIICTHWHPPRPTTFYVDCIYFSVILLIGALCLWSEEHPVCVAVSRLLVHLHSMLIVYILVLFF